MRTAPRRSVLLLLSFLVPAAVMTAVFAVCGLAPFGARTLGVMDMTHQYISFLYSLRYILFGNAGLLYLPSMCLGGNMIGVFAYYLASPMHLLTLLFPREAMLQAASVMFFLRVGLCGLTMCVYTGSRHGWSFRCLLASMAYAFMAYMLAYSFNYLWQDDVVLLPILALGIARLTEDGRPWLYVVTLAAGLFFNFYIGYMFCIFSVLFFLYEFLSVPRSARENAGKTLLRFVLSSLAAGGLAAVLLLPTIFSLRTGKASFDPSILTLALKFTPAQFMSKLYPGAFIYNEINLKGLPQVFCGTVTVCLVILYFANRSIPGRRRIFTGGLMLVMVLSFAVTALDLVWHGFNVPTWYNYRYSFLLTFLMAAAADRELANAEGTRPWHLILPVVLIAAASVVTFAGRTYDYVTWRAAIAAVAIAAVLGLAMLSALRPSAGKRLTAVLAAAILLVHTGELAVNAKISLDSLTAQSTDAQGYVDYVSAKARVFDLIDNGTAFVRTESPVSYSMNRCEPMLFGYDGVTYFGSTVSMDSLDFMDRLGFDRDEDWALYGPGVTSAADTLLGIRWLVTQAPAKGYVQAGEAEGFLLEENTNALPIGWTADAAAAQPIPGADSFTYMNNLYAAAAPEVGGQVFIPASVSEPETENFTREGDRFTRVEFSPASITYTVTAAADGPLYAEVDIPDNPGVMFYADGVMLAWYATAQLNGTVYMGDYHAGDTVTVKLQASSDITVNSAAFVTEDAAAIARYAAALAEGGCELTRISSSHFIGSFTTGEGDSLLVLTLPYDPSWHVTLDGQKIAPVMVQDCLMALEVGPGAHTVEMRYIPTGLIPGGIISLLALAACLTVYLRSRKKR